MHKSSDKPITWSPQGTYAILIKPEKVQFLGGHDMGPIITFPQAKVDRAFMSPCERYVLTYSPAAEYGFTVWDFKLVTVLREFNLEEDEEAETWRWSSCGNYIAKQFRQEIEKEDLTKRIKEGISIYELPSMDLLKTAEGVKKSISIEELSEWSWVQGKAVIVYTSHLPKFDDEYDEDPKDSKD